MAMGQRADAGHWQTIGKLGLFNSVFASVQVTVPAEPERRELPRITASAEELSAMPVHSCALYVLATQVCLAAGGPQP